MSTGPIRILHVGKYFPPTPGGMERYLGDLAKAQRAGGDDVAVLVHASRGGAPAQDPPWLMRCPVWLRLVFAPISPAFPLWLRRAIAGHQPDVLHLHMPNASVFWALFLPLALARPWVVQWQSDVEPSRFKLSLRLAYPFYRIFETAVLERAECIVVATPQYLESSATLRAWRHKCRIVPLGVDHDRLPDVDPAAGSRHWRSGGLRVLALGRLTYYKGFDTLIRAAARTDGPELVIAGSGEERPLLERVLAEAGSLPRIRLVGEVDDAALCELMATCDVLCLPSRERTEAFGIVMVEAMRYGKPVVASHVAGSGMTWIVRDGENGILVPPDDVDALAGALRTLAGDRGMRERLGRNGAERYGREFDIGRVAARLREVYDFAARAAGFEGDPAPSPAPPVPPRSDGYLVVIPALNEAACIGDVISRAREFGAGDILVVDDGSTDGTPAIARAQGATVVAAPLWQGAWGAIQTGIRHAVRHGYAGVVTLDADGQHEPAYLPQMIAESANADVVIAACPSRGSTLRHVAWGYFRLLTGFRIEDLTSGFRFYNARACRRLAAEDATLLDYQDIGVLLLLRHADLRIREISVSMNPRREGASRVFSSWWTVGRYMVETTLLCLARWRPGTGRQ